jgi:hypothetical protein
MSKRQKPGKSRVPLGQRLAHFKESCLMVGRGLLRILYVCTWLGLAGGSVYGLYWCHDRVLAMPEYHKPASIRLTNLPEWLRKPENKHVVNDILGYANKLDSKKDYLASEELASKIARNLKECPWVDQVVLVRKEERNGMVAVQCTYRMPTAWIQQEDRCYLVDAQGYRLPERYDPYQTQQSGLITILGAAAKPPEAGQPWPGKDVQAGLHLADMLPISLRSRIAAVDVSNYTGRVDRRAPDIKLQPRELSSEIFWGHAPEEEFDMELTALDKIQLLEDNLKRYGRIDGNRPYLDIRTTPPYQPVDRPGDIAPKAGAVARQASREAAHA